MFSHHVAQPRCKPMVLLPQAYEFLDYKTIFIVILSVPLAKISRAQFLSLYTVIAVSFMWLDKLGVSFGSLGVHTVSGRKKVRHIWIVQYHMVTCWTWHVTNVTKELRFKLSMISKLLIQRATCWWQTIFPWYSRIFLNTVHFISVYMDIIYIEHEDPYLVNWWSFSHWGQVGDHKIPIVQA